MDVERFVDTLKREQAVTALEALKKPRERDAFEYGLACGLVQGYERTLQILTEQQDASAGKPSRQQQTVNRGANPYLADLDSAPLLPEQMGKGLKR
jgi:hypothetical protein